MVMGTARRKWLLEMVEVVLVRVEMPAFMEFVWRIVRWDVWF